MLLLLDLLLDLLLLLELLPSRGETARRAAAAPQSLLAQIDSPPAAPRLEQHYGFCIQTPA
jgi:hypothetical protein